MKDARLLSLSETDDWESLQDVGFRGRLKNSTSGEICHCVGPTTIHQNSRLVAACHIFLHSFLYPCSLSFVIAFHSSSIPYYLPLLQTSNSLQVLELASQPSLDRPGLSLSTLDPYQEPPSETNQQVGIRSAC